MFKLLNLVYVVYVIAFFSLWIPLVLIAHMIAKLISDEKKRLRFIYKVHRLWIGIWEVFTRIKINTYNHHKLDPDQAYVFVANHNNMLDIPVVGSSIIHPWKSLAKKEIYKVPFVGWIIKNISISVDRSSRESRGQSLRRMIKDLENGISILIFPEGTRNRSSSPLKKFHKGAFRIAIESQKPIMPVVLTGIRHMQPVDTMEFYPGQINMRFLDPIPTKGLTEEDEQSLMDLVYQRMEAEILATDPYFSVVPSQIAQA